VISRFNAHASTEPFAIDAAHQARFIEVTRLALDLAERTGGAFDPTIQPLIEARGFGKAERDEPASAAELAAARERVDWRRLRIDQQGRLVKARADVALTYSALVPGWAADQIADLLAARGATGCMVDVGGEVVCRGKRPDGRQWTIGIARPTPPGVPERVHTTVPLDGALATSGSYRTFHLEGDQVVHHIFDPRTGENATHPWISVSVLADRCGLADGLATALMVVGPDGARPIYDGLRDRGVRILFLGLPDPTGNVPERRFGW
jgi:thiamine biosynthesis lipoprotein